MVAVSLNITTLSDLSYRISMSGFVRSQLWCSRWRRMLLANNINLAFQCYTRLHSPRYHTNLEWIARVGVLKLPLIKFSAMDI